VHEPDELARRRGRQELLARAHAQRSPERVSRWRPALALGLVAVALSVWGVQRWARPSAAPAPLLLQPSVGAHYTRTNDAQYELVELASGTVTLRVASGPGRKPVMVHTPDGSIEDIGTVFSVSVVDRRTAWISVAEGRVIARIAGQPPHSVEVGQTFRPYAVAAHADSASSRATPQPTAPSAEAQTAEETAPSAIATTAAPAPRASSHTPSQSHAVSSAAPHARSGTEADSGRAAAAHLFARAIEQVERHDDTQAAELLKAFLARYPDDHRGEDARFLHVVVLMRLGARPAAEAAARTYLARHPRGFRAPDVRALLERDAALVP
jgi:hypothetical protein